MPSTSTVLQPSGKKAWTVVIGATMCMIAASVPLSGLAFFHPYLFSVMGVHGVSQAEILVYITLEMFSIVASMLLIGGPLLPRVGSTKLMIVGSIVVATALVIFAQAQTPVVLYAGGILLGLGYGASYQLIPIVWVNNWFKAKKGLVIGIVTGGTGIGGMVWSIAVPGISGLPAPDNFDYRLAYYFLAGVVLVLTIPAALFLARPETPEEIGLLPYGAHHDPNAAANEHRPRRPEPGLTFHRALRTPWMWLVFLAGALIGVLHGTAQVMPQFLTDRVTSDPPVGLGQPLSYYSTIMLVWTLGLIVGKPLVGWLNDKFGVTAAMAVSLGSMSLFLFVMPYFGSFGTVLPFLLILMWSLGMSTSTVQPPLLTAEACGRKNYARIWTITGTSYTFGMAIGSPIWGLLHDPATGSYPIAFAGAPVLVAVIVLIGWVAMRGGKREYMRTYETELAQWEADHAV